MKIDRAIKVLTKYQVEGEAPCPPVLDDALKLGVAALERVLEQRKYAIPSSAILLPGEAKE